MKISMNWIKDYVNIPEDLELSRIAYDLTMSTVEVEGFTDLSQTFDKMVVGQVLEILPHPGADKLRICRTDIGGGDVREIVCGGINLSVGMKAAVALPGAKVRWHGEGDLIELTIARVRGVESYGMICASSEIGLFDLFPYDEEATIVDISGFDAPCGTSLAAALGLDDIILEIDNKSLTNRPDLWGHYGIARELSALYDLPLKDIPPYLPPKTEGFRVSIEEPTLCARYIGARIEGLEIKDAPFSVRSRIWRVGMRPINGIVDITNYVMLSAGQPTHAFDADIIKGHINVRLARENEKLLLLDGRELSLTTGDLVIADDEGAVALAGVMGGERDSILGTTDKVILEIANFNALSVRRTAARHEERTEAAIRYEKGIDPDRADLGLSMAMSLFAGIFPDMKVTGFYDNYPSPISGKSIEVSLDWLEKRLGKRIQESDITRILTRLGFAISFSGDILSVVAPTWRSTGDISLPDDIMEEIARIYGYENFDAAPITTSFTGAINQPEHDMDRRIREYLSARCGMREVYTYPWMSSEYVRALFEGFDGMLSLASPPSPDEKYLRASLLPNLCEAVAANLRFFNEFAIFESAQVFFNRDFASPYDPRESLPLQRKRVAGALVGAPEKFGVLFRQARGMIEALPRYTHIEGLTFAQSAKPSWADDVAWLNIFHGDQAVGDLGALSGKADLDCDIKNSAVVFFDLDIDSLKPLPSRTNAFSRLPEYPMTEYDLSLLFDLSVKWEDVYALISGLKRDEDPLRDVFFVDEYKGPQIPAGKKSLTLRLLIGSLKKTLTSKEIDDYADFVVKRLGKAFGAELRG